MTQGTSTREEWYLTEMKQKERRTWSPDEKHLIYTLRVKRGAPVKELMKMFGVSKVQIYNQIRYMRDHYANRCHKCRRKLTPADKAHSKKGRIHFLCLECAEITSREKKNQRTLWLSQGLCGICGKHKVLKGKTACKKCLSATQRRRVAKGLCGSCGSLPIAKRSKALCEICLYEARMRK